jgi:aryl-alcohol dehydrogenase-like predicted oxidoreductase
VVSVQNSYSIGNRSAEDVLQACEKLGIAFLPWYPLGAGSALKSAKVTKVAARLKAAPAQVAIAWLLAKSPAMLPIPGTSRLEHLEENAGAAKLELSALDLRDLD